MNLIIDTNQSFGRHLNMYLITLWVCGLFLGTTAELRLVWRDEFNGDAIDYTEWKHEVGGNGWLNNEFEFYTEKRIENARVENGSLVITARVEEYQGMNFTSARLNSAKAWAYGRFEARARLPRGRHLWPAIWMMPKDSSYGQWALSGEIDIMEARGEVLNVTEGTIHYGGVWPNNNIYTGSGPYNTGKDLTADYHIYTFEWDKNSVKWLFDGEVYHTENINRNLWSGKAKNPYDHNGAPFDKPFYWILNIAIDGGFFWGDNYAPITPEEARHWEKPTMEIDYLRVYQ